VKKITVREFAVREFAEGGIATVNVIEMADDSIIGVVDPTWDRPSIGMGPSTSGSRSTSLS
jgi:hypothetical protein